MESIRLAIGKNASGAFHQGHFGDADQFAVVTLQADGTIVSSPTVPNSSISMDESHGAVGKMKSVLASIAPLHCVVSAQMSPNFKRMALQSDVQPVVVKCTDDTQLFACLSQEYQCLFDCVALRQKGDRSAEIPIFDGNVGSQPLPIQNQPGDQPPEPPE